MDSAAPSVDSQEFYQTLVENTAEGLLTIDTDSKIVYANPAIEQILGYAPEELIGSSKMEIIPERLQPVHAEALSSYVETGERNIDWDGMELPALHKNGHEVPTLISLREHEHQGDQYFTGIIRDITERKKREQQLRNQRERLNQFADILAHDIRNPLSVAQAYTDILQRESNSPESEKIAESLVRIEELVDDVLDLSKKGRSIGDLELVTPEECVGQTWSTMDTGNATLEILGTLGEVEADRSRLQDLFANIFRNAIEHASGEVVISVGKLSGEDGIYF